ncbi:unnamed protein product [Prunus armeniaca]
MLVCPSLFVLEFKVKASNQVYLLEKLTNQIVLVVYLQRELINSQVYTGTYGKCEGKGGSEWTCSKTGAVVSSWTSTSVTIALLWRVAQATRACGCKVVKVIGSWGCALIQAAIWCGCCCVPMARWLNKSAPAASACNCKAVEVVGPCCSTAVGNCVVPVASFGGCEEVLAVKPC